MTLTESEKRKIIYEIQKSKERIFESTQKLYSPLYRKEDLEWLKYYRTLLVISDLIERKIISTRLGNQIFNKLPEIQIPEREEDAE